MITRSVSKKDDRPQSAAELERQRQTEDWLRGWVSRIAVPRGRLSEPRENRRIEEEIAQALADIGYSVSIAGPVRNVVAIPPSGSKGNTLVGAHFDSVPGCPGADDNASGVAALLRCAHDAMRAKIPVVFVAFNAEEEGLVGSSEFVASGLCADLGIHDAHILEMVGYRAHEKNSQRAPKGLSFLVPKRGDFLGLVANAPSRKMLAHALRAADSGLGPSVRTLEVFLALERRFRDLLRSDHAPLWYAGLPAVLWTDTAEFRNANYHQRSDTPDTLDYAFLREVGDLLIGSLAAGQLAAAKESQRSDKMKRHGSPKAPF